MTSHARHADPNLAALTLLIKSLTVDEYCDWARAKKPGLANRSPEELGKWLAEREMSRD